MISVCTDYWSGGGGGGGDIVTYYSPRPDLIHSIHSAPFALTEK